MAASRSGMAAFAALLLLLGVISSVSGQTTTPAGECPVAYSGGDKPLLFGGVIGAQCKRSNGQPCTRAAKW